MIITNSGLQVFKKDIHRIIVQLNKWLKSNLLLLNLGKTHFLPFLTKNSHEIDLQISYENKQISKIYNTKFLALIIGNNLSLGFHNDEIVPKLNKVCYVIGSVNKPFITFEVLRMTYFSLVHSVIPYGIIFLGTSSHIKVIFNIQKRLIRVIMTSDSKDYCYSQYVFSMLFFVKHRGLFKQILMFITLMQYVIMIYIFLQRNYSISKLSLFCSVKIYNNLPYTLEWL
jgi:hypothetical protein